MFTALNRTLKKKRTWIPLAIIIACIFIWLGYRVGWSGFKEQNLWNWMDLLIIPAVLGVGALLFNSASQKAERERATDLQRQESLMTYLNQMENLLLKHELHKSEKGSKVREIARARTLSIFRNLDSKRKRYVLQFLYESQLINKVDPVVRLAGSDLRGAELAGAELTLANFNYVGLDDSDLTRAWLIETSLIGAQLKGTILKSADLTRAIITGANLESANLLMAQLVGANLKMAKLSKACLTGANLEGANLEGANLEGADLGGANLKNTKLEGTHLEGAKRGFT
jgi:uncharacterized protein YjbI with pentapeptide repeats